MFDNFKEYSCYGYKNAITERGMFYGNNRVNVNWSDIKDALIRIAAKDTTNYASDIIYDINSIQVFIDEMNPSTMKNETWLLGFRRNGVDSTERVLERIKEKDMHNYRSIWRLDFDVDHLYPSFTMKLYEVSYVEV